ncbi:MAG TPA: StbB family protein [Burkholderiaceae bacterium]
MKIAVINFSGNVGKSTIARHLLLPRIPGAELLSVESLNAGNEDAQVIRGRQFGELQEYLQTIDNAVVDIGASNVEDLLALMHRYRGSHEDFDAFVIPTVAPIKQQQDTIATLVELARLGVPARRMKIVFNMIEHGDEVEAVFFPLLAFLREHQIAPMSLDCRLPFNEIYRQSPGQKVDIFKLAEDDTDYKALIVKATDSMDKLQLARKLAARRLAIGAIPLLDACFSALGLAELIEPGDELAVNAS